MRYGSCSTTEPKQRLVSAAQTPAPPCPAGPAPSPPLFSTHAGGDTERAHTRTYTLSIERTHNAHTLLMHSRAHPCQHPLFCLSWGALLIQRGPLPREAPLLILEVYEN